MITLKNYILYLFLFQFTLYSQATVKTNELKADNKSITDNTIAFNSNPTINVSLNVHLETSNGSVDNTFGNLYVYYKKNETDIPMQVGFHSVTFYLKTYYTSDILFNTVTLHKNEFYNTGGILYAEYKNNKNQTYQSTKIAITGGSLATAPPTPTNQKIAIQNLKYSEDLPIINSKIFVPNYSSTSFDLEIYRSQSEGQTTAINIYAYEEFGKKEILLKSVGIGGFFDSYFLIKNIKINYDALDFTKYTCKIRIEVRNYSTNLATYQSNTDILSQNKQEIIITLTKPIINNIISDNQSISTNTPSKPLTGIIAKINLDPTTTRNTQDITQYQWQQKVEGSNWTDIIGATFQNYTPLNTFNQSTSFRRIAISSDGYKNPSEYITISTVPAPINNICCNQTLPYNSSQPSTFTGNSLDNTNSYQWQVLHSQSSWINIPNATDSSCNYIFIAEAARGTENSTFRRLILKNQSIISVSNNIIITRSREADPKIAPSTPTRVDVPGRRLSTYSTESNQLDINNLSIYPNPIINNLFIEGSSNINLINLYDSFGQKIDINKHQKSDNLIEVNTSRIQPGIYILKIDNTSFSKTLIKN